MSNEQLIIWPQYLGWDHKYLQFIYTCHLFQETPLDKCSERVAQRLHERAAQAGQVRFCISVFSTVYLSICICREILYFLYDQRDFIQQSISSGPSEEGVQRPVLAGSQDQE